MKNYEQMTLEELIAEKKKCENADCLRPTAADACAQLSGEEC